MKRIVEWFYFFEKFVDRWWYSPALGLLSALDHYVVVFPVLGMMVSSVFLKPRKWLSLSLWSGVGSWFGAVILAYLARAFGLGFIESYFPEMLQSPLWNWAHEFFYHHGVWVVFIMGLAPVPQQPPMIVAALAGTPLIEIAGVLLIARVIKFTTIGYVASHAPDKLKRLRGVDRELKQLQGESPN